MDGCHTPSNARTQHTSTVCSLRDAWAPTSSHAAACAGSHTALVESPGTARQRYSLVAHTQPNMCTAGAALIWEYGSNERSDCAQESSSCRRVSPWSPWKCAHNAGWLTFEITAFEHVKECQGHEQELTEEMAAQVTRLPVNGWLPHTECCWSTAHVDRVPSTRHSRLHRLARGHAHTRSSTRSLHK
jgi:hypothetical protein